MTQIPPCLENLNIALLVKLGSLIRHFEEYTFASRRHYLDLEAITNLLSDPEVRQWMDDMEYLALLPLRR